MATILTVAQPQLPQVLLQAAVAVQQAAVVALELLLLVPHLLERVAAVVVALEPPLPLPHLLEQTAAVERVAAIVVAEVEH